MDTLILTPNLPVDLENMNLWPAIIAQLSNKEVEIRKGTAWVCGTAVQNNPKSQVAVSVV